MSSYLDRAEYPATIRPDVQRGESPDVSVDEDEQLGATSGFPAAILAAVADGITVQDAEGRVLWANDAAARLVGFESAAELLSADVADVIDRFDLLDERRRPLDPDQLPGRLALAEGRGQERIVCYRIRATAEERWSSIRALPVAGEDGRAVAVNVIRDITTQRRAAEQMRLLADASELLVSSLDVELTIGAIGGMLVPTFADYALVDLLRADGSLEQVVLRHVDPAREAVLREIRERYPPTGNPEHPASVVAASGAPLLIETADDPELSRAALDEEHLELYRRLEPSSYLVVPLVARSRTIGTLSLGMGESHRRYHDEDIAFAQEVAGRIALGVENSRLYAEAGASLDRLRLLSEAGELFASSLDRERILERVSRVVVPRIADACNIYLLEEGRLRRVAHAHAEPELERLMDGMSGTYFPSGEPPALWRQVVEQGKGFLASTISSELGADLAGLGLDLELFARVGSRSMMFVPFVSRGEVLGLLTLGAREEGHYDETDLELARELARRASAALDNARLLSDLEQRAETARALEFVADGVFLVDDRGIVRLWNPAAEAITGLRAAEVVGRRIDEAIPGWGDVERLVPVTETRHGGGTRAETIPVEIRGRELWLSISGVAFGDGTVYACRDLTEERAVERLKSDFVSTVSHELRTPLAAIYGAAMTLKREDVPLSGDQRDGMLGVVASESERLARIVNDILLASRLDSGIVNVSLEHVDPVEVARAVLAAAEAHLPDGIDLSLIAPANGSAVRLDADKVRQVLVNLVENAIKYSPEGGVVALEVAPTEDRIRFLVRDEGLGIPASEHGRIFEKFYRLDPDLARGVGGTGLGLYICREIVRRMDGRIWLESTPGRGSTFVVELPLS